MTQRTRFRPALASLIALTLFLATAASAPALEIAVVVHPRSPITQVSPAELKAIYLGETTYWNGERLVPVTFQRPSQLQVEFLERVVGVSGNAYKTYWIKRIFREGGIPPLRVSSVEEMVHLISQTPGAIGFIPAEAAEDTSAVRQVLRLRDK